MMIARSSIMMLPRFLPVRASLLALFLLAGACDAPPPAVTGDLALDGGLPDRGGDPSPFDGLAPEVGIDAGPDASIPVDPFALVLLPDTQYYTVSSLFFDHFKAQTAWIVQNRVAERLAFVSMAGDLVDWGALGLNGNKAQWERADEAMGILDGDLAAQPDGLIPYAAVPGNHDYDLYSSKANAKQYLAYFGPSRYQGRSWFLGASTRGTSMAQAFTADGITFLHLGLEWRPDDETVLWAQGMLDAHPAWPAIITTHAHLLPGVPGERSTSGETPNSGGDNSGESLYRKLVEPSPQLFLVLSGHTPGVGHLESTTALSRPVIEVLADYQFDVKGGNGWLVLIRLDPQQRTIAFSVFSPTYTPGSSMGENHALDPDANYTLTYDLLAHHGYLEGRTVRRFRQGQGGYAGARDTHIGSGAAGVSKPDEAYGPSPSVRVDGDEDGEQGLLRFEEILGSGPGQIPPGAKIERAILTLTTEGSKAESADGARLFRMRVPWDEAATWAGLSGPLVPGGSVEAQADLDCQGQVGEKGTRSFDVTAAVQAWIDGQPNHGWAVIANGGDRWEFRSSDWAAVAERPMLTVIY